MRVFIPVISDGNNNKNEIPNMMYEILIICAWSCGSNTRAISGPQLY